MLKSHKFFFISLLFWILGFLIVFKFELVRISCINHTYNIEFCRSIYKPIQNFLIIFFNNLLVAIELSFIGYQTFGILTIIITIYNGAILGISLNLFLAKYNVSSLYKVLLHAPTEIIALCYFSSIGLFGTLNLVKLFKNEKVYPLQTKINNKMIMIAIFLLIFSSLIESDLAYYLISIKLSK